MFKINIITIFPEVFPGVLGVSVLEKARKKNIWQLTTTDIKKFADKKGNIDDAPFGGGPGMIIRPDVLQRSYKSAINNFDKKNLNNIEKIILTPVGEKLDAKLAEKFSRKSGMIIICGRYEGVDERFIQANDLRKVSIGNYILSGGEAAAIVLSESVIRLLPNVLGNSESKKIESFNNGLLEYPQYTRPSEWNGLEVPKVLLSGNHKLILEWRKRKSQLITNNRIKNNKKNYR